MAGVMNQEFRLELMRNMSLNHINEQEKRLLLGENIVMKPGSLAESRRRNLAEKILFNDEITTSKVRHSARAARVAED